MRLVERILCDLSKDFYMEHPKIQNFIVKTVFKQVLKVDFRRTLKRTEFDTRKDPFYAGLMKFCLEQGYEDKVKEMLERERTLRIKYGIET